MRTDPGFDSLREQVREAIEILARGVLEPKAGNHRLRQALGDGRLPAEEFSRQLVILVYRLLFLFVAEDRGLLIDPGAEHALRGLRAGHSITDICEAGKKIRPEGTDLYRALRKVMDYLGKKGCPSLGLPALGSYLWSEQALGEIRHSRLLNRDLLAAVRALAFYDHNGRERPIDFATLPWESLGSVYEALLERQPQLDLGSGQMRLVPVSGHERKTTGSYYTPAAVIAFVLNAALEPIGKECTPPPGRWPVRTRKAVEKRLLGLKICDPACGSGHFLVAAARRLAHCLAVVRSRGIEPAPETVRRALGDVVKRCLYGVDVNPVAVELCKAALWLEVQEPGLPLSFLDRQIRCGNALYGVRDLNELIFLPEGAFDPIKGDDPQLARALQKKNAQPGQDRREIQLGNLSLDSAQTACDLWTSAFFVPLTSRNYEENRIPTTSEIVGILRTGTAPRTTIRAAAALAREKKFFHWPLAFDEVTGRGGFDVILTNPPFDVIVENRWLRCSPARGTSNLSGHFVARCTHLLAPGGVLGVVVPLVLACGADYEELRRDLYRSFGRLWASHYSIRPAQLFPGVDQRVTLLTAAGRGQGPCEVFSTRLHRWQEGQEIDVLKRVEWGRVGFRTKGLIPKVAGAVGASIFARIVSQPSRLCDWLADGKKGGEPVFYHGIGRYWIKAYDFIPFFQRQGEEPDVSTNLRFLRLRDRQGVLRFLCLVNSSLFYYWWLTQSDEFHVLASEVRNLRVPPEEVWPGEAVLGPAVENLMRSYQKQAVRRVRRFRRRVVSYDEFRPGSSLPEIHVLDEIVANLYGLTQAERLFLRDYDMAYRREHL